jgi:photoactive yellow protein
MTPFCMNELDDVALDALPFGVVCVGANGLVERYNRSEAQRAGTQRWRVLGRDYFRDVAGPAAPALAERVRAVEPGGSARVFHTFRGFHREDDAVIDIARCPDGERVYLCIRTTSRAM